VLAKKINIYAPSLNQPFKTQKLRIIKDGRHIQLLVNGKVSLDWIDDHPVRFGKPYASGKIGLRQMAGTVGEYRDFKVWSMKSRK
jgi:hypothetical protein